MIVIPAIDLKSGKCVRLVQGDFSRSTVYSQRPQEVAALWQEKGAELIHVVDLDGSLVGTPVNREAIRGIIDEVNIPIQVGGGIRDEATIEAYLALGVQRVVLGTGALLDERLVRQMIEKFPGRIVLGVDAFEGRVAIRGWTERTDFRPVDLISRYESLGLAAVVFTDIKRDGMEAGVNVEATRELAAAVSVPVIASGGVAGLGDLRRLLEVEVDGIIGVIVGKALYSGAMDLAEAIALVKKAEGSQTLGV
ncbi:MAG: 1-(5-phosphoribosyl)-5-[(5-phosphoribosylamino)methylideneamino]imidazole-4-carboxamide isomerase [Smithellaceae bacterium]|nr:1-(5-phosphoribosyl)-5-[(5-phosphoribosylamino)methylideneamino]imidazole-4-carboxamide isomerase [Smithellaceae bacterium]